METNPLFLRLLHIVSNVKKSLSYLMDDSRTGFPETNSVFRSGTGQEVVDLFIHFLSDKHPPFSDFFCPAADLNCKVFVFSSSTFKQIMDPRHLLINSPSTR